MKKNIALLAIIASGIFIYAFSCSDTILYPDLENVIVYGDTLTIPYNGYIEDDSEDLKIGFTGVIHDSRCPINLRCFWEGNALVQLSYEQGDEKEFINLNTYGGFTRDTTINKINVKLVAVNPYPVHGVEFNANDYSIKVVVKK